MQIEKAIRDSGRDIELIKRDELQQIRQFWLRDPNEPDWTDSLPAIYHSVYDDDIDWVENDAGAFTEPDAKLLQEIEVEHGAPAEMLMKLIEIELSMSGLNIRKGILNKIENVLKMDWGSLDEINSRNLTPERKNVYKDKLDSLKRRYEEMSR